MATNLKSKNKWRWFIGILVMLGVTIGALLVLPYILDALELRSFVERIENLSYGDNEYGKYIDGRWIQYRVSGSYYVAAYDAFTEFLAECGVLVLFCGLAVCMELLVLFLRNKRIWKNTEYVQRKGIAYVAEVLVFGLGCVSAVFCEFAQYMETFPVWQTWKEGNVWAQVEYIANLAYPVLLVQLYFFLCFWYLRPLFTLGVKEYLREYSLLWVIGRAGKRWWTRFQTALEHVDFSEKTTKLLLKAVWIQFAILLVCVCCWFIGIPVLLVYSVALFFFLQRQYKKAENGYYEVLGETKRIVNGELTRQIAGDFGMFQSLGEELEKVKDGFRKAVEEEVKSQRMKTELITNVSHDLKTPLTAIMTYVELLKNEEITPDERVSYVDTLDKKSKRLKVLIEDLFEVSKAASNTITLHPMEVDMGQLVKQVAVEYEEKFAAVELQLRKDIPEERMTVWVDGQKTSRILENLFSNICKYAMPGSRVYVKIHEEAGTIKTVLKNISAVELAVSGEEITERFVRGDASRNTEGSGLGLAIAKNLAEAQGGSFTVEIDGDLFKVTVSFPKQ